MTRSILRVAKACVQGRRHASEGQPCQDAAHTRFRNGQGAAALADGGGSARFAREGARCAVQTTVRILTGDPSSRSATAEVIGLMVLDGVLEALAEAASRRAAPLTGFACTLQFAAVDRDSILIGQLGDGRVGVREADGSEWRALDFASKGEFHNETSFVTSADASVRLRVQRFDRATMSGVVLLTDGAEEALYRRADSRFAPALETMRTWLTGHPRSTVERALAENLRSITSTRTLDDQGIVLMAL